METEVAMTDRKKLRHRCLHNRSKLATIQEYMSVHSSEDKPSPIVVGADDPLRRPLLWSSVDSGEVLKMRYSQRENQSDCKCM